MLRKRLFIMTFSYFLTAFPYVVTVTPTFPTDAPATSPIGTDAPATSPDLTVPSATSPIGTDAPATSPVLTVPSARSSIGTDAPTTSPDLTVPSATSPIGTDAPATSPVLTVPSARSSIGTDAPATSPDLTVPSATSSIGTDAPATNTTPTAATTNDPGCNASLTATATTSYFTTQNYPSNYDSNMNCHVTILSPTDTAIVLTFQSFQFEEDTYCTYDSFSVYDQSSGGSTTLIGTFCGTNAPGTITSSSNAVQFVISTDSSVQRSGANVAYVYTDNSYPNCKAGFTSYTASAAVQTFGNTNSPYLSNEDEYFLVENSGGGDLILQLSAMNVERATGCLYDRITIYNGACTKNSVLDTHCGNYLKRWELTGTEYLVHFHSDSSIEKDGFTMQYYLGKAGTGAPTTTTTTVGPPVSAEIFLINDVLTNYSSANFPVRNLSNPVEATIDSIFLAGISDLDEVQQKLTTTVQFEISWYDESMRWPTSKQSGISKILIPQNDIWKPDLALLNSFTTISAMGNKFMFVVVENDGKCTWKPYQILESTCQADMTDYPYDTQECDLKFSTWSSSSDQVKTIIGSGMTKHTSFVENSEWHLKGISQRNETINGQLTAVFTLKMKRNHSFIVFYVSIPVILLSLLNSLAFALPAQSGEKSGYAITVFLSFLVYVIVTFQKMPETSDTISLFAIYILILTGISNLTVIISVLEIRMMELKTKSKPMLQCTISFTKWVLSLQHRLLCIKEEVEERRYLEAQKMHGKQHRNAPVEEEEEDDSDDEDTDNTWPEFVSALDFVCFWVFLLVTLLLAVGYMVYLSVQ